MVADYRREEEDECHHCHGTDKCRRQDSDETGEADRPCGDAAAKEQHHQSDTQPRTTVDTEDAGSCQGITEGGLQHQSTGCQGGTAEDCRQCLGQT